MRTRRLNEILLPSQEQYYHHAVIAQNARSSCSKLPTIAVGADISWNAAAVIVALCVIIWKLDRNSN